MNSILITGCNRGLGLGLVKTLANLPKPPKHIFATCRDTEQAVELAGLAEQHQNINIFKIDLRQFDSYAKLVEDINGIVKEDGLNVLFNNAGVAPKSTRINFVKETDLIDTFITNTVAPIMLTKSCLPLLKRASCLNHTMPLSVCRAAIINMSSVLASIESNKEGGLYAYRTSKTALNAATKSLSIDLKDNNILSVCLHPGWVRTDMGGAKAPMDVETSCTKIVDTIMALNESSNGGFIQYNGRPMKW